MIIVQALVGIAVLAWVVRRQLRPQAATGRRLRLVAGLAVVGVVQLVVTAGEGPDPTAFGWALLGAGLVAGAGLGAWRATTMRLWFTDGRPVVQGSAITLGLWAVGFAVHIGLDVLAGVLDPASEPVETASVLLFVAVSLGAQLLAVRSRVRSAGPAPAVAAAG